MYTITIDADLCKKDGLCAMTCMSTVIEQKEKNTIPEIVDIERCYGCGQCVSICPQGAISHSRYPQESIHPIRAEYLPSYDQTLELIRSRRSKRLYKDKPVEKHVIEQVLEAARFGPSGHNSQTTEFMVIQDREVIQEIGRLTAQSFEKFAKQAQNPIAQTVMRLTMGRRQADSSIGAASELGGVASMFYKGEDFILRGAPVLLLFIADDLDFFAKENANLALQNATLAAEALGLGCFYTGFVVMASSFDEDIAKYISLPEHYKIFGALAVGYPRLKFRRYPDRNPAKVTWIGANGQ
jgi:nitroreductase/NAD-dependent dihydropyrimidine dehydrogenase PreA subunit